MPLDVAAEYVDFKYMGKKQSGDYVYYGFKRKGGPRWEIMRKDMTNPEAWQYAFGANGWSAAWADPTVLTYSDPPDS